MLACRSAQSRPAKTSLTLRAPQETQHAEPPHSHDDKPVHLSKSTRTRFNRVPQSEDSTTTNLGVKPEKPEHSEELNIVLL